MLSIWILFFFHNALKFTDIFNESVMFYKQVIDYDHNKQHTKINSEVEQNAYNLFYECICF
jgi:hypothetical protein